MIATVGKILFRVEYVYQNHVLMSSLFLFFFFPLTFNRLLPIPWIANPLHINQVLVQDKKIIITTPRIMFSLCMVGFELSCLRMSAL